jgi:peptide/nickel transport system permease protein
LGGGSEDAAVSSFFENRTAFASAIFLLLVALFCFAAPGDAYTIDPSSIYAPPSGAHWLGTDAEGRDFLARLLHGGRISLSVALFTAAAAVIIGASIGLAAGWFGGAVDAIVLRLIEANLSVPKLPLMLLFAALELHRVFPRNSELASIASVTIVVALFGWTTAARLARASASSLRGQDFVTAARALGFSDLRILSRHVLPSAAAPLIVATSLSLGEVVLYESVLSFLGLGVQPPVPSWGAMLARGLVDLARAPHLIVLPGLLTFMVVAAFQLVGDGIRDALDPRAS